MAVPVQFDPNQYERVSHRLIINVELCLSAAGCAQCIQWRMRIAAAPDGAAGRPREHHQEPSILVRATGTEITELRRRPV